MNNTTTSNITTEWSHDLAKMAVYKLDEKVKERLGESAASTLEARLGRSAGWWRSQKRNKSISFATLLAVLREVGEDPRDLLEELIRESDAGTLFACEYKRFHTAIPRIALLADEQFRIPRRPDISLIDCGMEAACHQDPQSAIAQITQFLPRIDIAEIPYGLGLAATSYRNLLGFEEAFSCVHVAQDMTMESGDDSLFGQLLLREAFIFLADGKLALAIDNCKRATGIFAEKRRVDLIGRALVDHASCLGNAGKLKEALQKFQSGLLYIDVVDRRVQYACYHGLAMALARLGKEQQALAWLEKALDNVPPESELVGRLLWLKGYVLKQQKYYERSIDLLKKHSPMDAILVGVDLATLLEGESAQAAGNSFSETLLKIMPTVADRYDHMQAAIENVIALGKLEKRCNYLDEAKAYLSESWELQLRSQLKNVA